MYLSSDQQVASAILAGGFKNKDIKNKDIKSSKMPDIKKHYQELAKKHKLPDFGKLNQEFEIVNIEETSFLLRSILSRIGERIEFFLGTLGEMLHPDSSNIYSIQEYRFFEESERKRLFDIYRMLMSYSRNSIEVSLMCNEKEEAKLINDLFNEWEALKPELIKYFRKMKVSWKMDTESKEDVGYLG